MDEQKIREHVHGCPLGWLDGKLIWFRGTTDADVIEWLRELRKMVGLKPQFGGDLTSSDK